MNDLNNGCGCEACKQVRRQMADMRERMGKPLDDKLTLSNLHKDASALRVLDKASEGLTQRYEVKDMDGKLIRTTRWYEQAKIVRDSMPQLPGVAIVEIATGRLIS